MAPTVSFMWAATLASLAYAGTGVTVAEHTPEKAMPNGTYDFSAFRVYLDSIERFYGALPHGVSKRCVRVSVCR